MARIFLNYRRQDSEGFTRSIYDRLARHFGAKQIFRDIGGIPYGSDFVEAIERSVGSCDVLLAVIGREWLDAADSQGRRRLDDPGDFVVVEIAKALERGIPVIPVLVENAAMPAEERLPEAIKGLRRRQAIEVSDRRFDFDMGELIRAVEAVTGPGRGGWLPGVRERHPRLATAAAVTAVLAAGWAGYRIYAQWSPAEAYLAPSHPETAPPQAAPATSEQESGPELPRIADFRVSPLRVSPGGSVHLVWKVDHAARVRLEPVLPEAGPAGESEHQPGSSMTYTLIAANSAGQEARQSRRVTVAPPPEPTQPEIEEFSVYPSQIDPGGTVTISWKVRNADQVQLQPLVSGRVGAAGTREDRPDSSREYVLIAANASGKVARETAAVSVRARPPRIVFFRVSPEAAEAGTAVTLSWKVVDAERAEIRHTDFPPAGAEPTREGLLSESLPLDQGTLTDAPRWVGRRVYTLIAHAKDGSRVQESVPLNLKWPERVQLQQEAPKRARLTLTRIFCFQDGTSGATDWHFEIRSGQQALLRLARASYDDKRSGSKTGFAPRPEDTVQAEVELPSSGRLPVEVLGYRSYGNKLSAKGAIELSPGQPGLLEVVAQPQNDGFFKFQFSLETLD